MSRSGGPRIGWSCLLAALAVTAPVPVLAQGGPGFMFKEPTVTLKLETGYLARLANSDIFDFTRQELTVSRHDFYGPVIGGEIAVRVNQRVDIAVGVSHSQSAKDSHFRTLVDLDDNEIEQTTQLRTTPIVVTARYYTKDRGRSVGRFAWVPNRFAPYVGGGVGILSYNFEQAGDFVDYDTYDIFYDRFISAGNTMLLRALAGGALSVGRQFELSGEVRYSYASAEMSSDFDQFDPLSLSGFEGVIGFGIRF